MTLRDRLRRLRRGVEDRLEYIEQVDGSRRYFDREEAKSQV